MSPTPLQAPGTAREQVAEVVIVGGGIAGSALATLLARGGVDVLVLERQVVYEDRVRGEYCAPWGVAEAHRLGLTDAILADSTRAMVVPRFAYYDEDIPIDKAEAAAVDTSTLLPGVPGAVNLGHPETCAALAHAAARAGARMIRGITELRVHPSTGNRSGPLVEYRLGGSGCTARGRLVVGADGRNSTVRRCLGIELHGDEARMMAAGILVKTPADCPEDVFFHAVAGRTHPLAFPQQHGLSRVYVEYPVEDHHRYTGPDRVATLLAGFDHACIPQGAAFATARAVRPIASFPWNSTWAQTVRAPGVVLLGDAGGYNNPTIGQGLSLSLRDAGVLAETILADRVWSLDAFAGYETQRSTRYARARATELLLSELFAVGPQAQARRRRVLPAMKDDPELSLPAAACLVGFDTLPDWVFTDEMHARVLAAA
ncbi:MAG: FAD-dependent oxidoreductase [Sporichthyaceae bacterium]